MTEPEQALPDGSSDLSPQEHDIVAADEDRRDRVEDEDTGTSGLMPIPEQRTFAETVDGDPDQTGGRG